jgi:hypothetical protein
MCVASHGRARGKWSSARPLAGPDDRREQVATAISRPNWGYLAAHAEQKGVPPCGR